MAREKVVILGAGPAGMAAAFGLTDSPELRDRYELTIYQMGWRPGGKCSTGREGQLQRFAQNGTHYLFGCYDNCFDMARRAYLELDAEGVDWFGRYDEAFLPRDLLVFKQFFDGNYHDWMIEFPSNRTEPGTRDGALSGAAYLSMILQLMLEALVGWRFLRAVKPPGPFRRRHPSRALHALLRPLTGGVAHLGAALLRTALRVSRELVAGTRSEREALAAIRWICREVRRWAWWLLGRYVDTHLEVQRKLTLLDFGCTAIIGIIEDEVYKPGGLAGIDRYEFREWLLRHGAHRVTVYAPYVTTWYDAVAAYEDGDHSRPNLSAAVSLHSIGRAMLTYKGAFAYQMRAEIGETFIAPVFECLRRRGVKFRFFHRIHDIVPGSGDTIDEVVVERQAELKSGDPDSYDPFIPVKGGYRGWPNEPNWDQLVDAETIRSTILEKIPDPSLFSLYDLDSFYTPWQGSMSSLRRGEDFDQLIVALPVDTLRFYASRLVAARPAWQEMVDNLGGVETQSIRLWFQPTLEQLGWRTGPPILSAYAPPFSTWEDNGQLAEVENWPTGHTPGAMATVFGALAAPDVSPGPDDLGYPAAQQAAAEANAMLFMERDIGSLWPGATGLGNPLGMAWEKLMDLGNATGPARFASQYVRANAGPNERYTMARAGGLAYRMAADGTGYSNLRIAGDWTRNGFLIGSVEGAIMGGLFACRSICGSPARIPNAEPSFS